MKLLIERLKAEDEQKVVRALKVLADWRYELEVAQLRAFLADGREGVRHAAGQYILSSDKQAYRQLLSKR